MLRTLRLQRFRSYVDTGAVELRKLNVFIGANNAGKSALLSTIELFLRSLRIAAQPLAFDQISSFASFDSVLRRHWSPQEARHRAFVLSYGWITKDEATQIDLDFTCKGRPDDNTSYVDKVEYRSLPGDEVVITDLGLGDRRCHVELNGKEVKDVTYVAFRGPIPLVIGRKRMLRLSDSNLPTDRFEVVHPYRPVPRSFYVLDDPGLSQQDRALLSFLIETWGSESAHANIIRQRIVDSLKNLGLIHHLDIKQIGKKVGPKVVEIQVAPSLKRQSVSIADVGFGLSQVLPLVAFDARLEDGYLMAYQPEVHLHPYAQSRLADLFSDSVQRRNQVFVETHSPDLILRLQSKVVGGELAPSDVRIFCLANARGETTITPVDFDAKGSPAIPWPSGFLDTSLSLARDLIANRARVVHHG